jgi:hypothetical protein
MKKRITILVVCVMAALSLFLMAASSTFNSWQIAPNPQDGDVPVSWDGRMVWQSSTIISDQIFDWNFTSFDSSIIVTPTSGTGDINVDLSMNPTVVQTEYLWTYITAGGQTANPCDANSELILESTDGSVNFVMAGTDCDAGTPGMQMNPCVIDLSVLPPEFSFKTFVCPSGTGNIVADSTADTFTFAAGTGITITSSSSTDTATVACTIVDTDNMPYPFAYEGVPLNPGAATNAFTGQPDTTIECPVAVAGILNEVEVMIQAWTGGTDDTIDCQIIKNGTLQGIPVTLRYSAAPCVLYMTASVAVSAHDRFSVVLTHNAVNTPDTIMGFAVTVNETK